MGFKIPADMNNEEMASAIGAKAVVSIRDLMVLLGATDEQLRDMDEQQEILAREPWRDKRHFIPLNPAGTCGRMGGKVDWSGTRFAEDDN